MRCMFIRITHWVINRQITQIKFLHSALAQILEDTVVEDRTSSDILITAFRNNYHKSLSGTCQ